MGPHEETHESAACVRKSVSKVFRESSLSLEHTYLQLGGLIAASVGRKKRIA